MFEITLMPNEHTTTATTAAVATVAAQITAPPNALFGLMLDPVAVWHCMFAFNDGANFT